MQLGKHCSCGLRFWSTWTVASCQRGKVNKFLCLGWVGSDIVFPACLSVLEACRFCMDGSMIAANQPLSRVNDTVQSALVFGSGSIAADGDGGDEDGLNDDGVEVPHHWL